MNEFHIVVLRRTEIIVQRFTKHVQSQVLSSSCFPRGRGLLKFYFSMWFLPRRLWRTLVEDVKQLIEKICVNLGEEQLRLPRIPINAPVCCIKWHWVNWIFLHVIASLQKVFGITSGFVQFEVNFGKISLHSLLWRVSKYVVRKTIPRPVPRS